MMRASFRDYINILRKNDELLEIAKPLTCATLLRW
jgi:hypothetical protein